MYITFKNSFNSGDLITMLPGIKNLYNQTGQKAVIYQKLNMPAYYFDDALHPVKDENGVQVCMNEATFLMMKPLLESQEYIEKYEVWGGEAVTFDFDLTRHSSQIPLPGGDIHAWPTLIFPQLECDLSEDWLDFDYDSPDRYKYSDKIIINRTARYNNPYIDYFFLKEYEDKLIFAGLDFERKSFCDKYKLQIPLMQVSDFKELFLHIANCRFFVGGQSLCWHLADAVKQKRILEVCPQYPNCFPTGANGHSFVSQVSLEYRFKQLLKETK